MKQQSGYAITGVVLAIAAVILIAIVISIYLNQAGGGDSTALMVRPSQILL